MYNSTIQENFTLPSKGLIYDQKFDPTITLRSMTVMEEMKRLSYNASEYKVMSEIIDDCIKEQLPISVYDMCIGDYQFLLHKIRIITYGSEYKMVGVCPHCHQSQTFVYDLDEEEIKELDINNLPNTTVTLPVGKNIIELRYQTPRLLDFIKTKAKERRDKAKDNLTYELLYTLMAFIKTVDGKILNEIQLEEFCKKLNLKDVNYLLKCEDNLNKAIGINPLITLTCPACGGEVKTSFRQQSEFFSPEID